MRIRLLTAVSVIVLLAACGSGDGSGTRPTIAGTLAPDASIVGPASAPAADAGAPPTDAGAPPTDAQASETQPEQPAPEAAAPDAAPSSSVALVDDGDDDSIVWWPWVLVALVVVLAVVALSRRRRPGPGWQTRTTTLLNDIDQLTSHLAALTPDGMRAVAQNDATTLATMRATLSDLIASAPDVNTQTVLGRLTTPIAELHGAIDAVALSAGQPTQPDTGSVAQRVTQLHTASASVRAELAVHS
jgi:hypothetical protein